MSVTSKDAERYGRYEQVVRAALTNDEFSFDQIKSGCPDESAAFVSRVVRLLESDGFIGRVDASDPPAFRWRRDRAEFALSQWIDSKVYNARITRAPLDDRPRERLLAHGAAELGTAELLAILVRSGRTGESAVQAGQKIAARYFDQLDQLPAAGRGELKSISPAVADTAYCQIMAGIELGRRIERTTQEQGARKTVRIGSSADAVAFCTIEFRRLAEEGKQEEFRLLSLDAKHQVRGIHLISKGLADQSLVAPREVFRPAIRDAATAVILVHNHPSGDPTPSPEDLATTRRLEEAGQSLGIQVLDHIIVARSGSLSIREYREYS